MNQKFSNNYLHYYKTSDLLHYGIKIITLMFYLNYFNNKKHIYQRKYFLFKIVNIIQFKINQYISNHLIKNYDQFHKKSYKIFQEYLSHHKYFSTTKCVCINSPKKNLF